ncbi:MAG: hypothetical protein K0Q75_30 [Anaerospora sp.]|nr:hypothetical protein [Anaerospora sp.]
MKFIFSTILKILEPIRFLVFKIQWRLKNSHNYTVVGHRFPINKVTVGKATYGTIIVSNTQHPAGTLSIGNYCSIAAGTKFLLSGEHKYSFFSTYPYKAIICQEQSEAMSKGPIKVCDDVWIGQDSMILSGVILGQGCIIGAGSIVAKTVPPYAIFAGGKIIKYRFPCEIIEKLLRIDFSKLDAKLIKKYIDLLYCDNINLFLESDLYQEILKIDLGERIERKD